MRSSMFEYLNEIGVTSFMNDYFTDDKLNCVDSLLNEEKEYLFNLAFWI
jgi:hypothetical protein